MRRRGLSLAEAIIAIFIMVSGFVVIFRLFHTAMQYSSLVLAHQQRVRTAQNKLEEIRAWSRTNHHPIGNVAFTDWTHWDGSSGADPENPELRWEVKAEPIDVYSPCSLFEKVYSNVNQQRRFPSTYRQISVTVSGGRGGDGPNKVRLTTLVGQPSKALTPATAEVVLSPVTPTGPGPQNVARGATASYEAELRTMDGKRVLDMMFAWGIDPNQGDGNGTFEGPRTGRRADFFNEVRIPDASAPGGRRLIYARNGATCRVQARCNYRGVTIFANSPELTL